MNPLHLKPRIMTNKIELVFSFLSLILVLYLISMVTPFQRLSSYINICPTAVNHVTRAASSDS